LLSITHRATGVVLAIGLLPLTYWLIAVAAGPESFSEARALLASWVGRLVLLGFSFSLFYHLCNGIRHMFWDAGLGFELKATYASGWAVVAVSAALTVAAWAVALY
jgi:succinate dehydrogenase / fumarate reductase cytochrome b subunit